MSHHNICYHDRLYIYIEIQLYKHFKDKIESIERRVFRHNLTLMKI